MQLRKCKFIDNEGESACSIINSITGEENVKKNDGRLAQLSDTQSVSISDCKFEIGRNSKCSLFYIGGSKGVKAEFKDSVFTGVVSNGAYHISGRSLGNQARKILIKSCRFSSSFNNAFNSDNNYMSIDMNDNHFNYKIKENKLPWKAVIAVIAVITIKLKKKPQDDQNDEHEMSTEIHESLIDQSFHI